ncbi:hypothetical protein [Novipirellula artificiosorum]|uniref:Uncharacterized protein n=1 Tax=Novipirellula artificiosorum TaxID=2528016 RepID=A0A5C6E0L7_9BACT|nr:hypothetical protein [Novipirellula artificiosorum]TWU42044.1 hypothetical protein Poly41_03400 [Novipirellula artificiosorum]
MHSIRLRYPWTKQFQGSSDVFRVNVPEPIGPASTGVKSREALYIRTFNCPTGIVENTSVKLCISNWIGRLSSLTLNGSPLAISEPPLEVEIAAVLQSHNRLVLELKPTNGEGLGLCGDVTLRMEG